MLTTYRPYNDALDYTEGTGWKAFVFGPPSDFLMGRWLTSKAGPGFHVFLSRDDAEAYAAGIDFGVVLPVHFKDTLSVGREGKAAAITARRLMIVSVSHSVQTAEDANNEKQMSAVN